MGIGREPAADAQREANLFIPKPVPLRSGESDIIDLRERAPAPASSCSDFELAGQVVELGVSRKLVCDSARDGRSIDELVARDSGQRASGHVAHDIAASSFGTE